jgi:RimJ/RimL family protein N-acetyltransferase
MLRTDTLRPYEEGDIEKLDPREMDLMVGGEDYVEKIKKNIESSETVTVQKDGVILAITGLIHSRPGVAEIWSITGTPVDSNKTLFAQCSILVVDYWIKKYDLHRLTANTHEDHTQSIRWLEWLGFEREGLMRKYGTLRENFYLYARTK